MANRLCVHPLGLVFVCTNATQLVMDSSSRLFDSSITRSRSRQAKFSTRGSQLEPPAIHTTCGIGSTVPENLPPSEADLSMNAFQPHRTAVSHSVEWQSFRCFYFCYIVPTNRMCSSPCLILSIFVPRHHRYDSPAPTTWQVVWCVGGCIMVTGTRSSLAIKLSKGDNTVHAIIVAGSDSPVEE